METTSFVRHAAQFIAGFFVSKGYIDGSMEEVVIGVITGIAALGWYIYQKRKAAA